MSPLVGAAAAQTQAPKLTPVSIAFWDARHGLLGAIDRTRCARPPLTCRTIVSTTSDGGRTWKVRYRAGAAVSHVTAVPGRTRAFASADCVAYSSCPAVRSGTRAARLWRIVPKTWVYGLTFGTAADGWAVKTGRTLLAELVGTTDGGTTWRHRRSPCRRAFSLELRPARATQTRGWLLCLGQPGAGRQRKELYETNVGGRAWTLRSTTPVRVRKGWQGLPVAGYGSGVQFRSSGRGWLWERRGSFLRSEDGGRTWQALPISRPEVVEAISASFVSDRAGFALFEQREGIALARTLDGGSSWTTIRLWRG